MDATPSRPVPTMRPTRRITHQFRFARLFYAYSRAPWATLARRMRPGKRRNTWLSAFGPLSVLMLMGAWALGLILGFALLHWSLGSPLVELRGMYEPFVHALSRHFLLALPPVLPDATPVDNWQTSAWMRRTCGLGALTPPEPGDDHLDG